MVGLLISNLIEEMLESSLYFLNFFQVLVLLIYFLESIQSGRCFTFLRSQCLFIFATLAKFLSCLFFGLKFIIFSTLLTLVSNIKEKMKYFKFDALIQNSGT